MGIGTKRTYRLKETYTHTQAKLNYVYIHSIQSITSIIHEAHLETHFDDKIAKKSRAHCHRIHDSVILRGVGKR